MSRREGKKRKELYFSVEDWKVIEKRARLCKLNTTKYIRKIALEGSITIKELKDISNLLYELNRIGNNINQLAKKANEINNIYKSDIDGLKQEYDELCLMLSQFLSKQQ
jgi:hypothetical protein